jgi:hypothetical protein
MQGHNEKYVQAASECLELARTTQDERRRAGFVALAQMWLDLAGYHSDASCSFLTVLDAFNDWQMMKR